MGLSGTGAHLFPETIRDAGVVRKEGDTTVVEVDHVEGKVVNILRDISATRTDLCSAKIQPRHRIADFEEPPWRGLDRDIDGFHRAVATLLVRAAV